MTGASCLRVDQNITVTSHDLDDPTPRAATCFNELRLASRNHYANQNEGLGDDTKEAFIELMKIAISGDADFAFG